jgi:hypothetical protein
MHKATCAECNKECEVPFKIAELGLYTAENVLLNEEDIKIQV